MFTYTQTSNAQSIHRETCRTITVVRRRLRWCGMFFNFHVADHHTYFVGSEERGFGMWAHSCYYDEVIQAAPHSINTCEIIRGLPFCFGRVDDPSQFENAVTPTVGLPADANGDNAVDFLEFPLLSQNYGQQDDTRYSVRDFNWDGVIDLTDFLILSENFGRHME